MRSISGFFLMAVIAVPAVVYQIGEMNAFELHSIVIETPAKEVDQGGTDSLKESKSENSTDYENLQLPLRTSSGLQTIEDEKQAIRSSKNNEVSESERRIIQKEVNATPLQRINGMSLEAWMEIKGIGQVTAERILSYRNEHGRFDSLEVLLEVKGIGPAKYAAIVEWLEQQK